MICADEIRRPVIEGAYPLTAMQRNLLGNGLATPVGANIEQVVGELREELDVALLERAWQFVVDRHSILRIAVRQSSKSAPIQEIHRKAKIPIELHDWRALSDEEQISKFKTWLKQDRRKGFVVDRAPLMRVALYQFAEKEFRFVWTFHHLLLDATSFTVILREVFAAYEIFQRGSTPEWDNPRSYFEFVEWLNRKDFSAAESFWLKQLHGLESPASPELPRPVAGVSGEDDTHGERVIKLSASELVQLRTAAQEANVTLNTFIQAAWALMLGFYSGKQDVLFGAVRAGRRSTVSGADTMVGLFINTVPVRIRIENSATVRGWLAGIRQHQIAARPYEHTPLGKIAEWSGLNATGSLLPTVVNFQTRAWHNDLRAQGGDWLNRNFEVINQPDCSLWLDAYSGDELVLKIGYCRADFEDDAISRLAEHLKNILLSLRNLDQKVFDVHPFTESERNQILHEWNRTEAACWEGKCAHQLFELEVELKPCALAVAAGGRKISYGEINAQATDLARRLRAAGVGKGTVVGVCFERSPELVVAILAAVKAGAAYAPLDPAYPSERLAYIVSDARISLVLTLKKHAENLSASSARIVCLDSLEIDLPAKGSELPSEAGPNDLAYVIYTSGSTGNPKGVAVEHGSLVNLIAWHRRKYQVTPSDRATLIASPAFDASVWELWPYLSAGASIHIPDEATRFSPTKLVGWLCAERISLAFIPTPLCEAIFDQGWPACSSLRAILTGGDQLHRPPPRSFPCALVNHYGPTESTVVTTCATVDPADSASPPIGRPIANTQVYLLDAFKRPVPIGVPGELHIGGVGLARGYLRCLDLTSEKFISNPFDSREESRLYQTGDLARYRPDGQIEYLGRIDRQIKIRGNRIELGEIESVLLRHPQVKEAAVVTKDDKSGARLVAFIVACTGFALDAEQLREFLRKHLPEFMVPASFALIESLPLTPNGKVDRKALDRIEIKDERTIVPPRTPVEKQLGEIWCEALGFERVGVDENFFELGGHSLAAARIVARLGKVGKSELTLHDVFDSPTIASLAAKLEHNGNIGNDTIAAEPIPNTETEAPLSFAQERLWFLEQLSPGQPLHNIPMAYQLRGKLNVEALQRALSEIIQRHEPLRNTFENVNGQPRLKRNRSVSFDIELRNLTSLPEADRETKAREILAEESKRPFDLTRSPLLRAFLLRLGAEEHVLLLVTGHIACDGWSLDILHRELAALYGAYASGLVPDVAKIPFRFGDFARWQRETIKNDVTERDLAFWKTQLKDMPAALELPTDRPRPPVRTYSGRTFPIELSAELTAQIEVLARRANVTPFMLLLAAFQTLLLRYSGQHDIVIGSPVAGRTRVEAESLIGMFLNTLILRGDLSGDPAFLELLNRTRKTVLDTFAHQNLPFEKLTQALAVERDLSRPPMFQVMFILQNEPLRPLKLTGLEVTPVAAHSGTSKFDLTLSLQNEAGALNGFIEYNTDLYDESTIARMAGHFRTLLEGVVTKPEQRVSQLPLLTRDERNRLLVEWNSTTIEFPQTVCIHELFEQQVTRTPDQVALVCEDEKLTYRELDQRANQLAAELKNLGVGPEVRVGICMERSLDMVAGLLAILKAGGAYVPLDPAYPKERLEFMLTDSEAPVLLTQKDVLAEFDFKIPNFKCLCVDSVDGDKGHIYTNGVSFKREQAAYVIYTSGSTGKPKGVVVTHRNVVNFFAGMDQTLGTGPGGSVLICRRRNESLGKALLTSCPTIKSGYCQPGVWLAVTSISFDISVLEIFWTLTRGFKVVIQLPENSRRSIGRPKLARKRMEFSLFYFGSESKADDEDKYRLLMEGAKFADENGFDAVWTPERHFHAMGGLFPNPSVTSAALAAITRRLQIRAGSVALPLHNPVRVAEEWSMVDNLSHGRAAISFASGWHANDFALAPKNFSRRKEIMLEGIQTIQRLWRGESISEMGGTGQTTLIRLYPRPVQSELPIWITSAGNVETFRLAGRLGFNVLTHLFGQGTSTLAEKIGFFHSSGSQIPVPPGTRICKGKVSLMLHTFLWEDREDAWQIVRGPLIEYLRTYRELSANGKTSNGSPPGSNGDAVELLLQQATQGYFESSGLFGTPESALPFVEELAAIGVNDLACMIDFGVSTELVLASLRHLLRLKELVNSRGNQVKGAARDHHESYSIPEQILRHKVTHMQCTPSQAQNLVRSPGGLDAMKSLKKLMLGGEALPVALAAEIRRELSAEIINMYGPTETTIWSATYHVEEVGQTVPIGRPIANTQVYILDENLRPVPVGVSGELFIGGEGVARGYLNRPELTSKRFVSNPFAADSSAKLYRTGDRARFRADGVIEFLGRVDQQFKLRGHRIEAGEIESVLLEKEGIRECVVTAREVAEGDVRLVAYLVAEKRIASGELRQFLQRKLPEHMVPASYVFLDKLPLTPNGKIDRKALPAPTESAVNRQTAYVAPRTDTEKKIASLWQELLRVGEVGLHDNFFDLGGHSLLVVQAQARLQDVTGVNVPVVRLFQFPTVGALAKFIGDGEGRASLNRARNRGSRQRAAFSETRQLQTVS